MTRKDEIIVLVENLLIDLQDTCKIMPLYTEQILVEKKIQEELSRKIENIKNIFIDIDNYCKEYGKI